MQPNLRGNGAEPIPGFINTSQINEEADKDASIPAALDMIASKQEEQKARTQTLLPNILLIGAQLAGTTSVSD